MDVRVLRERRPCDDITPESHTLSSGATDQAHPSDSIQSLLPEPHHTGVPSGERPCESDSGQPHCSGGAAPQLFPSGLPAREALQPWRRWPLLADA